VTRLIELIRDALDAAVEDGPSSWLVRGFVIGGVLVLVTGGAFLATSLLSSDQDGATALPGPRSAEPSGLTSPGAGPVTETPEPTGGVAGSRRLVADFDMLPTDSRIDGWTLTDGARLETAAQPTAVDRSARLDGEETATACQDLDIELAALDATFMLDDVPEGQVTLLALALDDGSTHRLTLDEGRATAIASGRAVPLEPGAWYRWVVEHGDDGLRLRLLSADGTPLTEGVTPPDSASSRAIEFCMTVAASARLYLSDLTVEIR
jgi:hypothetical protein